MFSISTYIRRKEYNEPFWWWLDRLLVMGVISQADWDRELGKFFGYPDCCIKWFIFMAKMCPIPGKMTNYLYGETQGSHVKCPKCIRKELGTKEKHHVHSNKSRRQRLHK